MVKYVRYAIQIEEGKEIRAFAYENQFVMHQVSTNYKKMLALWKKAKEIHKHKRLWFVGIDARHNQHNIFYYVPKR